MGETRSAHLFSQARSPRLSVSNDAVASDASCFFRSFSKRIRVKPTPKRTALHVGAEWGDGDSTHMHTHTHTLTHSLTHSLTLSHTHESLLAFCAFFLRPLLPRLLRSGGSLETPSHAQFLESLSLSLETPPPSLSRSRFPSRLFRDSRLSHALTRTLTHTHTHTHALTHSHTLTLTHSLSHSLTHSLAAV